MKLKLQEHEYIEAAWATTPSGPGWSNSLVWVLIGNHANNYRVEAIQPEHQTAEMVALFGVSKAAHDAMVGAVKRMAVRVKKP